MDKSRNKVPTSSLTSTASQAPAPQITEFTISRLWLAPIGLMTLLTYVTLSPPLSSTIPPHLYPGSLIRDAIGDWVIKLSWGTVVVFHVLESLYTMTLVKRHRTPFRVGVSEACLLMSCYSSSFQGHVRSWNPPVWLPRLDGVEEKRPSRQDRFYSQGQLADSRGLFCCTLPIHSV